MKSISHAITYPTPSIYRRSDATFKASAKMVIAAITTRKHTVQNQTTSTGPPY